MGPPDAVRLAQTTAAAAQQARHWHSSRRSPSMRCCPLPFWLRPATVWTLPPSRRAPMTCGTGLQSGLRGGCSCSRRKLRRRSPAAPSRSDLMRTASLPLPFLPGKAGRSIPSARRPDHRRNASGPCLRLASPQSHGAGQSARACRTACRASWRRCRSIIFSRFRAPATPGCCSTSKAQTLGRWLPPSMPPWGMARPRKRPPARLSSRLRTASKSRPRTGYGRTSSHAAT